MSYDTRDDIKELFGRFTGPEEAARAAEEIEQGDKLLALYPTPRPSIALLADIKQDMRTRLTQRRRLIRRVTRLASAVAAIVLVALLGPFKHQRSSDSSVSYASLIPAALWDSGDINADDAELAYFNAEIEQIEAQIRALQASDDEFGDADAIDEVEVELMCIDTEFWRE